MPGQGWETLQGLVITPSAHESFTENTPFYTPRNRGSARGRTCPESCKPHITLCKLQSSTHRRDLVPGPRSTSVTVCGTALAFLSLLFSETFPGDSCGQSSTLPWLVLPSAVALHPFRCWLWSPKDRTPISHGCPACARHAGDWMDGWTER